MTEEQKKQALNNAIDSYNMRVRLSKHLTDGSFSQIGNDQCLTRTERAIEEMEQDAASQRRWNYWLKQGNN